ncbi:MAG: hypothetical protein AAF264_00990 [Pseudomonadota bacterium]
MPTCRAVTLAAPAAPVPICPTLASEALITVRDLCASDGSPSELALSPDGRRIRGEGFGAPPLRAEPGVFVLPKLPMAVCPFCKTEADWPDDVLAVYTKRIVRPVDWTVGIETKGVLEFHPRWAKEPGILSMARLTDATYAQ